MRLLTLPLIFGIIFFNANLSWAITGFNPEPGSDIVGLFEHPELWEKARGKIQYLGIIDMSFTNIQHPLTNGNTLDRFRDVHAFEKLKAWGIELAMETGSVKPGIHCDAKLNAISHSKHFKEVKVLGGKISMVTMDWPRASGKNDCHQTVDETAEYVAQYANVLSSVFENQHPGEKLKIGLYEGYPLLSIAELKIWLDTMMKHGYKPGHFILDLDRISHDSHHQWDFFDNAMKKLLKELKAYCQQRGILFGVAYWSNRLGSPKQYHDDVIKWVKRVHKGIGQPDINEFVSWEYWVQFGNQGIVFPQNMPESWIYSHTGLLLEGLSLLNHSKF